MADVPEVETDVLALEDIDVEADEAVTDALVDFDEVFEDVFDVEALVEADEPEIEALVLFDVEFDEDLDVERVVDMDVEADDAVTDALVDLVEDRDVDAEVEAEVAVMTGLSTPPHMNDPVRIRTLVTVPPLVFSNWTLI